MVRKGTLDRDFLAATRLIFSGVGWLSGLTLWDIYYGCCSADLGPPLLTNQLNNSQNMSPSVGSVGCTTTQFVLAKYLGGAVSFWQFSI